VTLFCGGFGSGKTEVAVNFAQRLRETGRTVTIADLDIVNLYFRSRGVRAELRAQGIEVLVPGEALVNADMPIVPPEVRGALAQSRGSVVIDLGGDPVGAKVLASLAGSFSRSEVDTLLVLNSRRPFTATVADVLSLMEDIGRAASLSVSGVVVNSHLIDETTPAVIAEGIEMAEEVAARTGVRIAFVAVEHRMLGRFDAAACRYPVMLMDRLMLKPWERSNWLGRQRISI
jgi:hypothetical protein